MSILALLGLLLFHIIRIHLQVPIFNWDCIKFIDFSFWYENENEYNSLYVLLVSAINEWD